MRKEKIKEEVKRLMGEYSNAFDTDDINAFVELYEDRGEAAVIEAIGQELKEREQ